jgi:hypothetical protein
MIEKKQNSQALQFKNGMKARAIVIKVLKQAKNILAKAFKKDALLVEKASATAGEAASFLQLKQAEVN